MHNFLISSLLATAATAAVVRRDTTWQPAVGAKWQIMLSQTPNVDAGLQPADADIWDLDLFQTDASAIDALHGLGKKVICYFSAGTYEEGRPDLSGFSSSDLGAGLPDW